MTTLQEALPCPFCGKQHTLQLISGQELMGEDQEFWQHSESFGVVCDASQPEGKGGCGAMGGFKPTEEEAIEAWNTRTALAQQAATIANAEPAGWQPIETAPKDGRPILLFGDCRVTSGHWSAPSETPRIIYQDGFAPDTEWDEWEPYWESWDGGFTEEHPPTHWMPLPAAPKDAL